MKRFYGRGWIGLSLVVIIGLTGCTLFNQDGGEHPTSPADDPVEQAGYAQQPGLSATVTVNGITYQLNVVITASPVPYGNWFYLEMNQQQGAGKLPGVDQVPVQVLNVELRFTGLPAEVTHILVAIKDGFGVTTYTDVGRYEVQNGGVIIPVSYGDLIRFFGPSHYSLWFQMIGGQNEQGTKACGTTEVSGSLPDGQNVSFSQKLRCGSEASAPPAVPEIPE